MCLLEDKGPRCVKMSRARRLKSRIPDIRRTYAQTRVVLEGGSREPAVWVQCELAVNLRDIFLWKGVARSSVLKEIG